MSEDKKEKSKLYTTACGVASFCALTEPSTKFNPEGVYSVRLVLNGEESAKLMEMLSEDYSEAEKYGRGKWEEQTPQVKKKNPFKMNEYYEEELDEQGTPTGNFIFNFKMKASGVSKKTGKSWERKPALFDAKGRPFDANGVRVFGGTELRVSFSVRPYFVSATGCGISLALEAAQILRLGEGGRTASSFGFGAVEGYEDMAGNTDNGGDNGESDF